mgnify:CR=1 FL=1
MTRPTFFALLLLSLTLGCASDDGAQKPSAATPSAEETAPEAASGFQDKPKVSTSTTMVVAAHPAASNAGLQALQNGGSALDAVVAIQAMLTLVEPQSSGIGGGAFLLYYDAKTKTLQAWDGRETAPANVDPKQFLDDTGKPLPFFDGVVSGRSVGVPGVLRMMHDAHKEHGKLPFGDNFKAAEDKAAAGFKLSPRLHKMLSYDTFLKDDPEAGALLFDDQGVPLPIGTVIQNTKLSGVFKRLREEGVDAFYKGALADEMVKRVQTHPKGAGALTVDDLANYQSKKREAVCVPYRKFKVCGFPPPTSGGVTPLQTMKLLERFDLASMSPTSTTYVHLLAQAQRLAFADRGRYLADPDHVEVPTAGLLDDVYLQQRSALIVDDQQNLPEATFGTPASTSSSGVDVKPGRDHAIELPSTSHYVVVDAEGNIASITTSVENVFGSRIMVQGFLLNNQLTDFSFAPVDDEGNPVANSLAPHKRPRSSMSPMIVFHDDGRPAFAVGSPGGSRIIGYVTQTALAIMDQGLHPQDAVSLPHVMNRGKKTEVEVLASQAAHLDTLSDELGKLGHDVMRGDLNSGLSVVQFIYDGDVRKELRGGADPRRENTVVGD